MRRTGHARTHAPHWYRLPVPPENGTQGAKRKTRTSYQRSTPRPGSDASGSTSLASFYLEVDFGADAVRPKSANTIPIVKHYVMDYLVPRWGNEIAEDIRPFEIQKWLLSLHRDNGLAWTTVSKIRGIMHRAYKIGILHERVSKNPLLAVETRSKSHYRAVVITPAQTLAILEKLINPLHYALTLTCAATALRASEILALRWDDVLWDEGRIRISKRWAKGADGETKTEASDGYVPMHPLLSSRLKDWHRQSPHAKGKDFVFPSLTAEGKVPLNACSFVKDHLRVAAKASGVQINDGQRFGLHNLRHSLSNWMVNKGKVDPKPCRACCVTQRYRRRSICTRRRTATQHGRRRGLI